MNVDQVKASKAKAKEFASTFKPTEEMKAATRDVFVAMAAVETIRPIVESYQRAILAEGEWHVAARFKRSAQPGELIVEPKDAWLMPEEDFAVYDAACKRAREMAGLYVEKDEFCPLLVAESDLMKAERALIDVMAPVSGLTHDRLMAGGMDAYKEGVRLTLRLMGSFVQAEDAKRFIRCEEGSLGLLKSLGVHFPKYDAEHGGVEAILSSSAMAKVAQFPADFKMEPVRQARAPARAPAARNDQSNNLEP